MAMVRVPDQPVAGFLAALGGRTPSPGGGATAALAGALGAAQLLMAAEYATWDGAEDPRNSLKAIVKQLPELAEKDAEAYGRFAEARKSRKENPAAFAQATKDILGVPVEILELCVTALRAMPDAIRRAPGWFACDLGIAYDCLKTGFEGARSLAGSNLATVAPEARDPGIMNKLTAAEKTYDDLRRTIDPLLAARQGGA